MFRICLIASLSVLITGCSSTEGPTQPDKTKESYIELTLVMPPAARAESHPDEAALDAENSVADLNVFIFNDARGVNAPASTPITKALYIDNGFIRTDNTLRVEVATGSDYAYTAGDRIAVTVNTGDLSSFATLGELQAHIPAQSWRALEAGWPSDCRRFSMASAFDSDGLIIPQLNTGGSAREKRFSASLSVERTAARIDLAYAPAQENSDFIEYVSTSGGDGLTENGRVRLYCVSPVNAMQQASYSLKRISSSPTDDYSCFGTWTYTGSLPKAGTRPDAYVIEPHTTSKTLSAAVPAEWYGNTAAATAGGCDWGSGLSLARLLRDDKLKLAADGGRALILAYTNENTQHVSAHSDKWLTGLLLHAVFVPATVYADGNATVAAEYGAGQTFWRYRRTDTSTTEDSGTLYFASEEAARAYAAAHATDGAEITAFPSGRCFYNLWIRHTVEARDPETVFPMEYGIVRNHIYRVRLSFRGAGKATPDIDGPENAQAAIYVRPWNLFRHDLIII